MNMRHSEDLQVEIGADCARVVITIYENKAAVERLYFYPSQARQVAAAMTEYADKLDPTPPPPPPGAPEGQN